MLLSLLAMTGSEPAPPGEHGQGSSGRVRGREREQMKFSSSDWNLMKAFLAQLDVRFSQAIREERWLEPQEHEAVLLDVQELRGVLDGEE